MKRKIPLLFLTVLIGAQIGLAGEITINPKGTQVYLSETDTRISFNLSRNFTDFNVYEDRVKLNSANFSVRNNSKNSTELDIFKWNLSKKEGRDMVNFTANSTYNHTVEFEFENLTADENYTVRRNGSFYQYVGSNASGDISFNYSEWNHDTFTLEVTFTKPSVNLELGDTTIKPGYSIEISCSAFDEDGIASKELTVEGPDKTHSANCDEFFDETEETGVYVVKYEAEDETGKTNSVKDSFNVDESSGDSSGGGGGGGGSFSDEEEETENETDNQIVEVFTRNWTESSTVFETAEIGNNLNSLERLKIETRNGTQSLSVRARDISTPRNREALNNVYSYTEINISGANTNEIEQAELDFVVNNSFKDRFDTVKVQRYQNGWKQLQTNLTSEERTETVYTAFSPGFSIFAVQGQNISENETEKTENETKGENDTCKTAECLSRNSTDSAEKKNSTAEDRGSFNLNLNPQKISRYVTFVASLVLFVAIISGGVVLHRKRESEKEDKDLKDMLESLEQDIRDLNEDELGEGIEDIKEDLNRIQHLIIDSKYSEAEELIGETREKLSERRDGS